MRRLVFLDVIARLVRNCALERAIQYPRGLSIKDDCLWNTGSPGQAGRRHRTGCLKSEFTSATAPCRGVDYTLPAAGGGAPSLLHYLPRGCVARQEPYIPGALSIL